ncbi:hypothetical protein [Parabacteroides distasonis]|uniref:hypothetical protein n=1 Tax=Parabacteroides distasonis TaxID=823 RepID=UPI001F2DF20C|nr:hypothetical protein [Parabacteroides distasonis]MCE9042972.1 hypothetical protein [Parabacteroides distasonis]
MIVDTYKRTVLCVYRHRPTRILALASANVGVSRCRYTCGMELAPGGKQVQVMQVMQHLFPTHARVHYIRRIKLSYGYPVFLIRIVPCLFWDRLV